MRPLTLLLFGWLVACTSSQTPHEPSSTNDDEGAMVCEPGRDQTCNDDPAISSLHGTCKPDGSCECADGIEKNPATGRCR